jgi:hypothetical protein
VLLSRTNCFEDESSFDEGAAARNSAKIKVTRKSANKFLGKGAVEMKQKDIFLQSEGDAWFARNQQGVASHKLPDDDPLLREILDIHDQTGGG